MTTNFSQTAAYIWSLADLLRGDFKQSQYGRIILPFTILRRLECVLEARKPKVLDQAKKLEEVKLEEGAREKLLFRAADQSFYNTSPMDLSKLGSADIKSKLIQYLDSFSWDAREIFEHFRFDELVGQLDEANLLFKIVQRVAGTDLNPKTISDYDMGLVFEELTRRFAEGATETAGEHFTPRDIVRLTTSLVFMEDDEALTEEGIIRRIYDPTAGTGGFLSSAMEYIHELNPRAVMRAFGQELNPESYAICKGFMLIKGQDVSRIRFGNTLSDDQLYAEKFGYMLSNPPFGAGWKKIEDEIREEHNLMGFDGRFGPGLPRVNDGSLLFLMHLIRKMRDYDPNDKDKTGGRIGIILNGSPLFTGGAGSGESEIRRHILESDLLETIVALPTDMLYNTGIATYVWVLSNKKTAERKGKVQLINGVHLYQKMRRSLGSKRQEFGDDDIALITRTFGKFEALESYSLDKDEKSSKGRPAVTTKKAEKRTFGSKILANHEFGYRRITIERPLRLSVQFTDERLAELRFTSGRLNAVMRRVYELYGQTWTDQGYGQLAEVEAEVRALRAEFKKLTETQVQGLLAPKIWTAQKDLLDKAVALQATIGTDQHDDFNEFRSTLKKALRELGIKLGTKERKQLLDTVSWTNPDAEPVVKKVLKTAPQPINGTFEYRGQVVRFEPDSNLRDHEDIRLTAATAHGENVDAVNKAYFYKEVDPHAKYAWVDSDRRDDRDGQVGLVGYEIPFARLFTEFADARSSSDCRKLKTLLFRSRRGKYEWDSYKLRFTLAKEGGSRERVDFDERFLSADYFNFFLASPESADWRAYASTGASIQILPITRLMECDIHLPSLRTQEQIVQIRDEYDSLVERIDLIRGSILSDPARADAEVQKYQRAGGRFEDEFTHILPHPLSVLWIQAQAAIDNKTQCEEFVVFYEYLGLFSVCVIFGQLADDEVKEILSRCARGRPDKPKITMGTSYNLLRRVRTTYADKIHPQFKLLTSEAWVILLKEATTIRNEIAHRGLHAKAAIKSTKNRIDSLNDEVSTLSRGLFEQIILLGPRSSKYVERSGFPGTFLYTADSLRGLALNPSVSIRIETLEPMVDGELYIVTDAKQDAQTPHRVFPFMKLLDTDDENGIAAFYFYNQWDREQREYIYVCPYPSAAHQQHLGASALFPQDD